MKLLATLVSSAFVTRALVPISIAIACSVTASCAEEKPVEPTVRKVDVVRVQSDARVGQVAYTGEVVPRYETALGFRVAGKIVGRFVDLGDKVKANMVLAQLDRGDQRLNSQADQSRMAVAQANYNQIKGDLERYTELYRKEFISRAEYDRRRTEFDVAAAQLAQVRAELAVTDNQAGYTQLRSGHSGVVTAISAEVGQVVAAGQTVMRVARSGEREVAVSVPENKLRDLDAATEISINLWANPQQVYVGKVREVSPIADPVTRTYAARVSVLDADANVSLGMTANVYLQGLDHGSSVELPATVIFQKDGNAAVWVVDAQSNQVRLVPVQIEGYFEDKVAVNGGLKDGEMVVRAGVHKLYEGERVQVLVGTGS